MRIFLIAAILCWTCVAHAQKTLALVLTGGGARGISQIGVLKVLEREGIVPDIIVGSSFGAIVGGLYASGYTAVQIDSIFHGIDWDEITAISSDTKREALFYSQKQENDRSLLTLQFRNFTFVPPTAIGGSARFAELLQEILWRSPLNSVTHFDNLACRFRAVATNLADGSSVALDHGNLATAVRASATFPLRYSPVRWGKDTVLVDGGLVANIPIDVARAMSPDVILLVNTTSDYASISSLNTPWAVADQALTAAMKQRDSARLKMADILAEPDLGMTSTFDFRDIDALIRAGEREGERIVSELRARLMASSASSTPGSTVNVVKRVAIASTFSADTLSALQHITKRMTGGTWSPLYRRIYEPRCNEALHRVGFDLSFVRSMNYDVSTQTVMIQIDRGFVSQMSFDRLENLRRSDIEREASFDPGNEISTKDLERTWQNMHASDVLADAEVVVSHAADSGINVSMHADDRGNQTIRLGARIDNERYTQGGLDLIHENFMSTGIRIAVRGVLSQRIGLLSASLEMPRINGTLWTASLRGYTSFRYVWIYQNDPTASPNEPNPQRVGEYSEERYGFRLSAGRQLERNGVLLAEFRYEQQRYVDRNSSPKPVYQPVATLRGVARWDDRDNVYFATRGRTIDLSLESSILSLSNSLSFTKFSANAAAVLNLGGVILTPSAMVGAADLTLPGPELFSLGGQDLFFGWREDQQRGRQVVVGSVDARIKLPLRIFFDSYVSIRYDIGAIWENPEYIRIGDMNHGIGLTIGVDTPIGPARFSVGRSFHFLDDPAAVAWGPLLAYFAIGARL
ncbi:MAG: patatin-like phospholipase family protein [Candidatus Kapabacteria bacterium]|nr:patatin-like phospholipase family protein [Candidatus Kapabacteria bacterium]